MMRLSRKFPLFLSAFFLSGCQEHDVHVYRIAKEHPATAVTAPMLAESAAAMPVGMPTDAQPSGDLSWKVPAVWQSVPASGMRLASFAFQGKNGSKADISVVALPGEAGGNLANVNRWRGQLGLEPMDESGMAAHSQKVKSKAGELLVVDFAGTDPKGEIPGKARMLGAILSLQDKQWFFKVMGEDQVVAQAKPSFLEFVRSIHQASTMAQAPAVMPAEPQLSGNLSWETPTAWQSVPASGMRLASFAFQGKDGSKADISVVVLPGMAGGNLANVNRWRGQLGLEPTDEPGMAAHSEKVKSKAGELLVVDFAGADPKGEIPGKARMLGAILSISDKQWFFKVMGEDRVVAQAKPSFLKFLRSLKRASNG